MTVSVAAHARVEPRTGSLAVQSRLIYSVALVFWLATRILVLAHQGAWPWMNSFVVDASRGIIVGNWLDAVRPQLPAVLGVPLALLGLSDLQIVAALYVLTSLAQFGAFLVMLRATFPDRLQEQSLALLVFLLLPFSHSIHHYRDTPVLLASTAIFLMCADVVRTFTRQRGQFGPDPGRSWRAILKRGLLLVGLMVLGIWSRIEVLAFVGILCVAVLLAFRRRGLGLAVSYAAAAIVAAGTLLGTYKVADVDVSQAWFYTAHTFLDSTPDSWLTPACRANPTENCREADGLGYFGPANLRDGVFALAMHHPLTTLAKSARSAWDNVWILVGPNLSTFPLVVPFLVVVLAAVPEVRAAYRMVPKVGWVVLVAIMAESVLPPLTWAPPHPQYHVALVLPMVVLLVPALFALLRMSRARWLALGFLAVNAGLSVFRYSRYPGY